MVTVSVCMIVKNEEKVLRRCLDSLKGLYEELVIVDTGSTDSTKSIAMEYTNKVYDFEWINDFSAARNYAFSKCNMEYIYSVDADEVLDEENRFQFKILKDNLITDIEIVQMLYVTPLEHNTTENFEKEYRPKLFKRLRTFTWIDPIHETLRLDPVVFDSDIEILHLPINNHSKRDFGIFERVTANGDILSERLHNMYSRELMISGKDDDFIKAKEYFLNSLNMTDNPDMLTESYCVICHTFRIEKNEGEFLKYFGIANSEYECSELCKEAELFYRAKNDDERATLWKKKALETYPVLNSEWDKME